MTHGLAILQRTPTPRDLVEERDKTYNKAWEITGEQLYYLQKTYDIDIFDTLQCHTFAWIAIYNKLMRMLFSPGDKEHPLDIQGYCELMLRDEEGMKFLLERNKDETKETKHVPDN
jgi:hypothetical protein